MKHIQFYWGIVLVSTILLLNSCHKDVYEPGALEKNYFIQNIPEGFNWSSVKNIQLRITPDDQYNGQYPYKIEIFDHNPAVSDSLIRYTAGWCTAQNPLKQEMTVRATDSVFFVRQTTPGGNRSVTMASIENDRLIVSFAPQKAIESKAAPHIKSTTRDDFQIPTEIPANARQITTSTQLTSGNYYIDNTFSGNLRFPPSGNCNLYISGEWRATAKNYILENQSNIYILPGGKLIPGIEEVTFTINSESTFSVAKGGQLGNKDTDITFKFNKGAIYNDGNFYADDINFDDSDSKIINTGNFSADDIKMENPGKIDNQESGNFKADEISMNGGSLSNKGILFIKDLKTENKVVIENFDNAFFTGEEMELAEGGTLINQCYLKFKEIDLKRSSLELASGSSVECEELESTGSVISLNPNSLLNITEETDVKDEGITSFKGLGNTRSLIRTSEIKGNNGWKTILFSGNLCVEYKKIPHRDNYRTEQGVTLYNISKDEYAPIEINPGKCTGNQHHPNPDDTPVNPVFPKEETFSQMYTYASEDNYPSPGDYDMNDLVLSIDSITYTYLNANSNEANISKVVWHFSLRAVGAVWRLGAALQIDNMPENYIQSITYTENPPLNYFRRRANGTEQDQKYAVIPLFDNAHKMLGSDVTNTIINTISNEPKYIYNLPVKSFQVALSFTQPVHKSQIDIPKLNYFVFVGTRLPRTEIHMSGYDHTDLSNISETLKENTGKFMWTIQVPQYFEYPHEWVSITKAYPTFEKWVTSGGTLHQDWYHHNNKDNLYTR